MGFIGAVIERILVLKPYKMYSSSAVPSLDSIKTALAELDFCEK